MSSEGRDYYNEIARQHDVPMDKMASWFDGVPLQLVEVSLSAQLRRAGAVAVLGIQARRLVSDLRPLSWHVANVHYPGVSRRARNAQIDNVTRKSLDAFGERHVPSNLLAGRIYNFQAEIVAPDEVPDAVKARLRPSNESILTVPYSEILFLTTAEMSTSRYVGEAACYHSLSVVRTTREQSRAVTGGPEALSLRYVSATSSLNTRMVEIATNTSETVATVVEEDKAQHPYSGGAPGLGTDGR